MCINEMNREKKYKEQTSQSKHLFKKAKTYLPEGIGGSAAPYDPYPFFVERAKGSRVWDVDGNEYLDFNMCWGVMFTGHAHPKLNQALKEQIEKGTMYGLPHEETIEVAKELTNRFPIEKLRFCNSGSEATLYAARLARRFTGKDKIVKIEGAYDGVADPLHVSKIPPVGKAGPSNRPSSVSHGKGIPRDTIKNTLVAPFNDIKVMKEIFEKHLGEIAAVLIEPVMMNSGVIPPEEGYLKDLRSLTREYNIPLIFDEVKTGVKIAPGGACEYYDIKPDIVCLAKAIGGGLPISAVGGKKEIIEGIGDEGLFGTFSANPLSIRAAKVTLKEILTKEKYTKVEKLGKLLLSGYEDIIEDNELKAIVQGINGVGGILFTQDPVRDYRDWIQVDKEQHYQHWLSMVSEGVIPMAFGSDEEWLVSVQHTEADIQEHLEVFKEVAASL